MTDEVTTLVEATLSSAVPCGDYTDLTRESTTQIGRHDDVPESTATATTLQLSPSTLSSCFDDRQAPLSKPVAMVQPRKVHGVRVLPHPTSSRLIAAGQNPVDATVKPSRLARSPAIRALRPPRNEPGSQSLVPGSSTSRWTGRRLTNPGDEMSCDERRHHYARCVRRSANHNSIDLVEDSGTNNWQCRVSSSSSARPSVGQLAAVAESGPVGVDGWSLDDGDGAAHEALLMTKKKDAEIAALLRHIRLGGVSRDATHVQRRPAFNECLIERINFERSLGYYP